MRGRSATIAYDVRSCRPCPVDDGRGDAAYIWNASNERSDRPLPACSRPTNLSVTELVAVRPPEPLATFLDLNGYLPIGVPMLKRVLALPGQTVCRKGLTISVDAIDMGEARRATVAAVRFRSGRDAASLARTSSFS